LQPRRGLTLPRAPGEGGAEDRRGRRRRSKRPCVGASPAAQRIQKRRGTLPGPAAQKRRATETLSERVGVGEGEREREERKDRV